VGEKQDGREWYDQYLWSPLWREIRARVLNRDSHRCFCGNPAEHVHHRSYHSDVLFGLDDTKLISICQPCHYYIEFDQEGVKRSRSATERLLVALLNRFSQVDPSSDPMIDYDIPIANQSFPCKKEMVYEAVLRTLPDGPGKRNDSLWKLARSLASLDDSTIAECWRDAVHLWWRKAYRVIRTKELSETWTDFRRMWPLVNVPMSQSRPILIMQQAVKAAPPDKMSQLMNLCRSLAGSDNQKTFFLSCRKAGQQLGISHVAARQWIEKAVTAGQLVRIFKGSPSAKRRVASRYRLGHCHSDSNFNAAQKVARCALST
jgi:hypothetical protein